MCKLIILSKALFSAVNNNENAIFVNELSLLWPHRHKKQ